MKRRGLLTPLLGAVLLSLAPGVAAQVETAVERLNRELTDGVVVPAHQRFATDGAALETAIGAFCAAPTPARLAAARQAFAAAMDAWQAVQPIGFGPVRSGGLAAVVQLFPDRRDAVGRQLNRALAAMDPALVAAGGLAGKSIALTGFPALERILFDDARVPLAATTPATAYACAFARAVARNLAGIAADLLDQWQRPGGFRAVVLSAAGGNDVYYDAEEVAGDLLQSLHGALDLAIAAKLEPALGATPEDARPKRLESWRSALSLANLRANLSTARALYEADGGFGELLAARGGGEDLDREIRQTFARIFTLLDGIDAPLAVALAAPGPRTEVLELLAELKALRQRVWAELAPALGLLIGFNATDGD